MNCPCFQVSIPDPNCTAAKKVTVFPVEFVVRGYITGSTDTSLWTHYKNGETHDLFHSILLAHLHRTEDRPIHDHQLEISNVKSFAHLPLLHNICTVDLLIGSRNYCGIDFPDGLVKNQKLAENLVTPTTKAEHGTPQPPTPNFQTLNPKPTTANLYHKGQALQNPNPKTLNPKPRTQNPKPRIPMKNGLHSAP
jgi:phosphoribosylaminoimidazole-succinocarboxamide synthase